MNWVNNYYKPGPATKTKVRKRIFSLSDEDIKDEGGNSPEDSKKYETSLYAHGNFVVGYPEVSEDNWNGGIDFKDGAAKDKHRANEEFNYPKIIEQTAQAAYPIVLSNAGASLSRDSIDMRIVKEVLNGTATYGNSGIIDSPDDVCGLPELKSFPALKDSDQDGMPDKWEIENGLNPDDPNDRNFDMDMNGYTNLEKYLNNFVNNPYLIVN
jgi:hypothetical protein